MTNASQKKGRGGAGRGQGRKKNVAEEGSIGKGFATRVMNRIGELGLQFQVGKIEKLKAIDIKSAEDYALSILATQDSEAKTFFRYIVDRRFGKPVQATIQRDTRETSPELDFGNLTMPASSQSRTTGQPN